MPTHVMHVQPRPDVPGTVTTAGDDVHRARALSVLRGNLLRAGAMVDECTQELRWRPDVAKELETFKAKVDAMIEAAP